MARAQTPFDPGSTPVNATIVINTAENNQEEKQPIN